jgi:DNA invertase Pin-like site-specific DNA recombinase
MPRLSAGDEELEKGAGRQLNDYLRPMAQRLGVTVVAELGLKDRSASKFATKVRQQYREAMAMVDAGQADVIIFYDLSRLTRQPRELEDLIDRVERTGLQVYTHSGEMRLDTVEGRLAARVIVTVAAAEVEMMSRRIKDYWRAERVKKMPASGRAFGWIDRTTPDPKTAPIVDEICHRILNGESMSAIGADLSRRGVARPSSKDPLWDVTAVKAIVTTPRHYGLMLKEPLADIAAGLNRRRVPHPTGKTWTGNLVRAVMTNPTHHGLIDREDLLAPAVTDPITSADYDEVLANLAGRTRNTRPRRATLLAGLMYCAVCGMTLQRNSAGGGRKVFACRKQPDSNRCGAGPIDDSIVRKFLLDSVYTWADDGDLAKLVTRPGAPDSKATKRRLDVLDVKEDKLTTLWVADKMGDRAYHKNLREIKAEREQLLDQLANTVQATALRPYLGKRGLLKQRYEDGQITDEVMRQIILEALELQTLRIVVDPPAESRVGTTERFNPEDPATIRGELIRVRMENV